VPADCRQPTTNPRSATLCADLLANCVASVEALRERRAPAFVPSVAEFPPATTKDAVFEFDDHKGFTERVNASVDRGVVALRSMQKDDGSFGDFRWGYQPNVFPIGQTCLAVLALLASGVQKSDPAITKAVAYVLARPRRVHLRVRTRSDDARTSSRRRNSSVSNSRGFRESAASRTSSSAI
jgi:hypothetical protein